MSTVCVMLLNTSKGTRPDGMRHVIFGTLILVGWTPRSGRRWIRKYTVIIMQYVLTGIWSRAVLALKSALAADQRLWNFLNRSKTVGQRSLRGESVSYAPGRKWRTENTELGARLLLRKPGHPACASQGLLDTFPPAALGKQTRQCAAQRLSGCAAVEYDCAESTVCFRALKGVKFWCKCPAKIVVVICYRKQLSLVLNYSWA